MKTEIIYFEGLQNHCRWWLQPWNSKKKTKTKKQHLLLGRKALISLDSILKSRDITLPTKVCLFSGFFSGHVWMWELNYKESWTPKNWCFWSAVLEKTLESPLDSKEIIPVNPKGNKPWILIRRTDAEAPKSLSTWWEELTLLKRSWCWERLKAGGEGDDRGWDGWMA